MKKIKKINRFNEKGQSMIEYVILFSVVVAVVVVAVAAFLQPSLEGLYQKTADVIDDINPTLIGGN